MDRVSSYANYVLRQGLAKLSFKTCASSYIVTPAQHATVFDSDELCSAYVRGSPESGR